MSCRICLGGPEESPELGRLISPCKCTGSTRYVHIACLQTWRQSNTSNDRFYRCDICHYEYGLRRVQFASMLLSKTTRTVVTVLMLNAMAFALGYCAYPILQTTLTDEDIDLVLRGPNIILRQLGFNVKRRILKRGSLMEHHVLGTAAIGALGFFKFSLSFFYSSAFRRRRTISLIIVLAGLVYTMMELYKFTGRAGHYVLRKLANFIVNDVPAEVPHDDEPEEDVKSK